MIKVEHLTKCYGDFMAVKDLSFEIDEGHVYGFLGPNGAGKSTTMNIMTGCLSATDGKVSIGGHDVFVEPEVAKRLIGYLPEQPPLYMNETPLEYLQFVGEAKGLKGTELKKQIAEVMAQAGIDTVQNRLISALSKGYKQRVGIAQALLGNPKVIILDEPTVGLDPIQIIEIRDLIRQLGETHTVILSSHILSEVQAICEQVLIISKGKLVAFDTPGNLEKLMTQSNGVYFKVQGEEPQVQEVLEELEGLGEWQCEDAGEGAVSVYIKSESAETRELCCKLFFAFAEKGLPIFEMTTRKANLEDVFIELTEDAMPEAASGEADIMSEDTGDLEDRLLEPESDTESEQVDSDEESEVTEE